MRPGPVARAAAGGVARRRVQTFVIGLVLLVATGASVLAAALLVDSSSPFDRAFVVQHGAHVVATVDPARATGAELAATRRLPEVTAAAGPFGQATVTVKTSGQGGLVTLPPMTLVGRGAPGGPLDDLTLQSGHWARQPGQIVLSSDPTPGSNLTMTLGTRLTVTGVPGEPVLTVVGMADSVNSSAAGWCPARSPGCARRARRPRRRCSTASAARPRPRPSAATSQR
jgi:putative ABC transport system permease protein